MAHLARNYASEAKIKCPKCDTSEKGRKLKIHIKSKHKLSCLYTCTFPISEGQICNFACGKSMSCFIHHQEKRHHISFADGAEHEFTTENYFAYGLKPIGKDDHTPACDVERKSFKTTSQARVNLKQSQERAEAKKIRQAAASIKRAAVAAEKAAAAATARRVKAESLAAARKRKASCSDAKRPAKRAKKCYVEETPTNNALVLVNSTPVGNSVFAVELPNAMEYVGGSTQPEEGVKKPENENDDEAEFTKAFYEHFYADQDISDSDESDDDEAKPKPKELDEVYLYKAGCGRFSPDVRQICTEIRAEMRGKYLVSDQQGWKKYVRQLHGLWHPDKNAEYAIKATEVFKCVQNQREKLEGNMHFLYTHK